MKFKFGLERVLKYRSRLADQAQNVVQKQLALVHAKKAEINDLYGQIQEALNLNQQKMSVGGRGAGFLQINSEISVGIKEKIKRKKEELRRLEIDLEDLRAILLKKKREEKSITLLRDRQEKRHSKAQKKRDQKNLDDLVVMRHGQGEGL